jgi:error-prone DNA polymerase
VLRPDILRSGADAGLEPIGDPSAFTSPTGDDRCLDREQPPIGPFDRTARFDTDDHRRDGAFAVRLGLAEVGGIGKELAERIVAERESAGDYASMADLVRRVGLHTAQLESLAAAGAFESLGLSLREALWAAGDAAQDRAEYLSGSMVAVQPPLFSMPSEAEVLLSDLWATGISPNDHIIRHLRPELDRRGVLAAARLAGAESGRRVEIAGVVTHRQRPQTASGITFMNLEDETGLVNVICSVGVWSRYRRVARDSRALIIRGMLERSPEGVTNLLADRFESLEISAHTASRDFH